MKKLLNIVLCFALIFTLIPGTAAAKNGPGQLYWIDASTVTNPNQLGDADWNDGEICGEAGVEKEYYFAAIVENEVILITDHTTLVMGDDDIAAIVYDDGNGKFKLEFRSSGSTWMRAEIDPGHFELGIDVSGGNEGPSGPLPGQIFWAEADKISNPGSVTAESLNDDSIWHTRFGAQPGVTLQVYFVAVENGEVVWINDPTRISTTNGPVARISGRSGNVLTVTFENSGEAVFSTKLNDLVYELAVTVSGGNQGGGNDGPSGPLPGQLYWAFAENVAGQSNLNNPENWNNGRIQAEAGTTKRMCFASIEDGVVTVVNNPSAITFGDNRLIGIPGGSNHEFDIAFKGTGNTWMSAVINGAVYELGITINGGSSAGQIFWAEADKISNPGSVTVESLNDDSIWHTRFGAQPGVTLQVYFVAVENGEVVWINDPTRISTTNGPVARISGRSGNVLTVTFENSGEAVFSTKLNDLVYELAVTVSGGNQGGGNDGPSGPLPGQLYFIYAGEKVALKENSNLLLIDGKSYEGDRDKTAEVIDDWAVSGIESQVGGHRGYFVIKDNSSLIAVSGVRSSDNNIVDIRYRDDGTQEIRMKNPGTAILTLTSDDGEYSWEMAVTGTVSGLNIRGGGWTAMPGGIGNGIFLSEMKVYDGDRRLIGYEEFDVKLVGDDIGAIGITPGNTIEFIPTAPGSAAMVIIYNGHEYNYDIEVRENDLNQGGGNERPKEPYDIFVLSSCNNLASLTEEEIKNTVDFGIIQASLTHEDRFFTGYIYVATREFINKHWVYTGFRKPYDYEKIFADYSGPDGSWPNSIEDEVTGLTWTLNNDGTYTFKHHGDNTDDVQVQGEDTYGYSVGLYEEVPEGIHYTCDCMPFQFAAEETAPVIPGAEYNLTVEQLLDPSDIQGWPYGMDYMCVNGQGSALMFNSRITSWYASFFVRNQQNDYDARYVKTPDTNEIRTYIGAEGQYVLQAREYRDGAPWVPIEQIEKTCQVFSMEYIGAKKGFYPVVKVDFDAAKDDLYHATERYQFRILYTGADRYLDNGNSSNRRIIDLYRDENMAEFDIDEYWWSDIWENWNTGNVLHFDYIGTTIKTKLNIRPGVMKSVADRTWYDEDDYIFVENEAENLRFYASWRGTDGIWQRKMLTKDECPFTVTWNPNEKIYEIKYAYPELDTYGPHYEMCYTGDYNSKINAVYGYEEGTVHHVENASSLITGKLTLHVDEVPENGRIDATTDEDVLGTEVILGENALGEDQTELEINTNDGNITLGGALVGNIKIKNGKVHFKMWNVKEEKHYTNDKQNEEIKKAEKAFDFKIDTEDADIDFGEDGYATIRIPYDGEEGYIYYINEKGEKEYVACVCEDGYIEFTAKHFSVYAISDEAPEQSGNEDGFSIYWDGQMIPDGGTITVTPGALLDGEIYYGGKPYEGPYPQTDSSDENLINPGASPDGKWLQGWMDADAQEGDSCWVEIYYGENLAHTARFKVVAGKPAPTIELKLGDTIVRPTGTVGSGDAETMVEILLGGEKIPAGYHVGTNGNSAVCDVRDNGDGTFTVINNGNGDCNIIVDFDGMQCWYTWHVAGFENAACDLVLECGGERVLPGGYLTLAGHNGDFTGKIYCNGAAVSDYMLTVSGPPGSAEFGLVKNDDGTFTITTPEEDGYTQLVLEYVKNNRTYKGRIDVQVQTPERYVFQFHTVEPDGEGGYEPFGYATMSVFKQWSQEKYYKFVITDEDMRRVDRDHFVAATPQNLELYVYDKRTGEYVKCEDSPFTITSMDDGSGILKITYDRLKDFNGPAYMLKFTGDDKYLDNEAGIPTEDTVFIWTKSVREMADWNALTKEGRNWHYDGTMSKHQGMAVNDECFVKQTEIVIPNYFFGEEETQIQTGDATLEIETELGSIMFDQLVLQQIDREDEDIALTILDVEPEDEEYQNVAEALVGSSCIVDLKLQTGEGRISDFGDGWVTVRLPYVMSQRGQEEGRTPYVYYVDSNGVKHLMTCQYDAENCEIWFVTNHFSLFAVEEMEDLGEVSLLGDVNMDGKVNAADLTRLARYVAKLDPNPDTISLANSDVNGDKQINALDLTRLARYISKIIIEL